MMKYYLKTDTEEQMYESLEGAGLIFKNYDSKDPKNQKPDDADENWEPTGSYVWQENCESVVMIGGIAKATGNMVVDDDGNEIKEFVQVAGYHANVMAKGGLETQLPVIPTPNTPSYKWAGE
jgi:hypothetical protein